MRMKQKMQSFGSLALLAVGTALVLALALGGIAALFYGIAQRQSMLFSQNVLKSSAHGEQVITTATKDVFDSMSFDSSLFDLINYAEVQPQKLLEGLRQLRIYRETNYFIDSIYIYNYLSGTVYVSSPNAIEAVWALSGFYDAEAAEIFAAYSRYSNMQPISRELHTSYPALEEVGLVSYLRYNTLAPEGQTSVIMINVRQETFFEQMYTPLEGMDTSLLLVDGEGNSQLSASLATGANEASFAKVVQTVLGQPSAEGYMLLEAGGAKTIVCYRPAFGAHWTLIFTANQQQMFSLLETSSYFGWILVFGFLFALLCFACGVVFRRLAAAQKHSHRRLQQAEAAQREAAYENKRQAALGLLHATGEAGPALARLAGHGVAFAANGQAQVVIIALDYYTTRIAAGHETVQARAALKYGVCNIAEELLAGCGVQIATYENDGRCVALLSAPPAKELLEAQLQVLQLNVEKALEVSLSFFVSQPVAPAGLPAAYESLCNALAYKKLFGPGSIVTADALTRRELQSYTCPDDALRAITKQILSMDMPGALVRIREMLELMAQSSYKSFQLCLMQLVTALDDALDKLQRNHLIEETQHTGVLIYNLGSLESVAEIYTAIAEILQAVEEAVAQKQGGRHQALLDDIRRTVREGCSDRGFSVNTVAEAVGMSPAYVGRLFKRSTGTTLVEHILEVRMQHACTLLAATDLPVTEIVAQVGFGDAPYFYKVFKKMNGCTPAVYRQSSRKGQ